MGTIKDKLDYLAETKKQIKQAIIDKGVSVSDGDAFRTYPLKIADIQGGGKPEQSKTVSVSHNTGVILPLTINPDEGYTLSRVNLKVDVAPSWVEKTVTYSANGTYTITNPTSRQLLTPYSYSGISKVTINVDVPQGGSDYDFAAWISGTRTFEQISYNLSGIGTIAQGAFAYSSRVTNVYLPEVTKVESYAFYNCETLKSVNLPKVSVVGSYAFRSCSSLSDISLENCRDTGTYAFAGCTSLSRVSLPKLSIVSNMAFQNCSKLLSISLPECTMIGAYGFAYCSNLTKVVLPRCSIMSNYAFYNCSNLASISVPALEEIGSTGTISRTFMGCNALTSISLPLCTFIASMTFSSCSKLSVIYIGAYSCSLGQSNIIHSSTKSIYVPMDRVEYYKKSTYWSYYSTKIVGYNYPSDSVIYPYQYYQSTIQTFPPFDGIEYIGKSAFYGCRSLVMTEVYLPNCSYLAVGAFCSIPVIREFFAPELSTLSNPLGSYVDCTNLENVTLGLSYCNSGILNSCSNIKVINLPYCLYTSWSAFASMSSLENVDLPLCSILGQATFSGCYSLEEVYAPNARIVSIWCFYNCRSLQRVDIGNCHNIGVQAFYYCENLETVIGKNIGGIEAYAFFGCGNLKEIHLEKVITIGSGAFMECSSLSVVNLRHCSRIYENAFSNCFSLKEVYVGEFCELKQSTYIGTYAESIFVPNYLVDYYKSAPEWSEWSEKIYGYDYN